ncbi:MULTISPECIES: GNA1162 family protein [unclassified Rhizobacter]|uniref:DUF799 domain-containing protein n=1 Tax=unclassified Rhizobacter TaxID=2640088 RepID=UPI0006F74DAE|nr:MULTISPECIES: GNA1162 family protein [unclassified Rhizobacter]KQU75996.1 hypothetical protein ASC88_24150 [Rhizobacter sp. Root29]KQW08749.1 hypothetical protein ASC98_24830 [Rhizobacter sp. Root1238]KRB16319.1 hypothetical protein ASE08_25710 [Rhizobacter sp. Root16D2]
MTTLRSICLWACVAAAALLGGCATSPGYDYTAFNRARPASLLVLPPLNESPEISATASVWSHATRPLAEAGYYVLPVTLIDETLRQNGVDTAHDAQEISARKLREFFGADAAVYIKVRKYGASYAVLSSETRVEVEARIVDLRSGELLWNGSAVASSSEEQQQSQGGLIGALVGALVRHVMSNATDESYRWAGVADDRMLGGPRRNGVPPGPRSPLHGQPMPVQ